MYAFKVLKVIQRRKLTRKHAGYQAKKNCTQEMAVMLNSSLREGQIKCQQCYTEQEQQTMSQARTAQLFCPTFNLQQLQH
jgi:hypothetical protein